MPRLDGKIAVITGGSSGIGLATAKRFVKEGAYVFITGRRKAELDKAEAEIGSNVTAVKGDVANPNDLDRLYQTVAAKKGKLDILFANAGIADSITGRISCRPELFSVTRNCLIVAGEASRGHYIFQLVDNGPDHRLARPRCPIAAEVSLCHAGWTAGKNAPHVRVLEICNRSDVPLSIRST